MLYVDVVIVTRVVLARARDRALRVSEYCGIPLDVLNTLDIGIGTESFNVLRYSNKGHGMATDMWPRTCMCPP